MQLTPLQKMSVTVGATLVIVGLFAAVSYYAASRLVAADHAVERTNTNVAAALRVVVARQEAERAAKAYVVRGDTMALGALQRAQANVEEALDVMARGTDDNPRQRELLGELGRRVAASFDAFRTTALIRDHAGADSARRYLSDDLRALATDSLMKIVAEMRDEELRVLAERTRLQVARGANAQRLILAGMVLTFLLAGVALQPMRAGVASRLTSHLVSDQMAGVPGAAEEGRMHEVRTSARLHAVHALVAALDAARDTGAAARALVGAAAPALQATVAAVVVPNGAGGFAVLAASDAALTGVPPGLDRPVADVLRTGAAAAVESRRERDRLWGDLAVLDALGARGAVVLVPMTREGAVNGVLLIALAADHVFGDDELLLATTFGRLGGPAVAARPFNS